jgi:transcriptional regulator with XRE-family HTH domain
MTQREWADAAGVAPSTVTGLMRGTHRASTQVATRLAHATRLSRGTLFPSLAGVADAADLAEAVSA